MFDTLIKGGTLIDGTGAKGATGDVAIRDGKIVEVGGRISGQATRTIDADGALVTPGFVDPHSHYDGQVTWEETLDPSFSNGITTTMIGNCGVGFAPARPQDRDLMISLMEGVEDIPGIVLSEGVPWAWNSYPEYLDFLGSRQYGLDFGAITPHAPMRVYAMGERAVRHEQATAEELEVMTGLVSEAIKAGSFGISSGRIAEHMYGDDRANVPGTFAEHDEYFAMADAMKAAGGGLFQMVMRGTIGVTSIQETMTREDRLAELALMKAVIRRSGGVGHYLLPQFNSDPDDWAMMLDATAQAHAEGLPIYAHVASRGGGLMSLLDAYHNFLARPSYVEIAHLPLAERAAAMRDPVRKAKILSEENLGIDKVGRDAFISVAMFDRNIAGAYLLEKQARDAEPGEARRASTIAKARGVSVEEATYDHLAEGDGSNAIAHMIINYANGNLEHTHAMLQNPHTLSSLGDGGAHVKLIADASLMPLHLTYWARDREGPKFSIETMVERITHHNAKAFGLHDRGVLAAGKRADINVIDFDGMKIAPHSVKHDLPLGGARLDQGTSGFLATLLNGTVTREKDADTGARPGRLLRANQLS